MNIGTMKKGGMMKLKLCPICKEYLNETEDEEWCSKCDYFIFIEQKQPKTFRVNKVDKGLRGKLGEE